MLANRVPFSHPWDETTLRELADVIVGGTPSTAEPGYWGGDVPWMSSGDVHQKRIKDVPGRITDLGLRSSNAKLVRAPAVAVALAGQGKTRGTVALTLSTLCTNQSVALIKPLDERLRADYLFHALDYRYEELRARSAGAGRAGLTKALVGNVPMPLPDPDVQQAIAKVLDTLDRAIEHTKALIAKYQRLKTGLFHDLLTRGIDQRGELRNPETHSFKSTDHGPVPTEWEETQLACLSHRITSGSRGWAAYYSDSGAKFIRIGNLTREHIYLRLNDIQHVSLPPRTEGHRTALEKDDLLISITADLGIIGVVPDKLGEAYINQHIALVKPDARKVNSIWLGNFLAGSSSRRLFTLLNDAGAKSGLNLPTIASFPVVRPDTEEQNRIAEIMHSADTTIMREKVHLQKLIRLRAGLMHDLLTGTVSVAPLLDHFQGALP